nr:SDR family NAD(P)-dependent oxidoreductase [Saccharopolyspora sp. HNM0983]
MNLRGADAVVTGASSGIGAAVAHRLAARGCRVVLVGRDRQRLQRAADGCAGAPLCADVTEDTGFRAVAAAASRADVLVHCAGAGFAGDFAAMPPDRVAALTELDLTAPLRLTRAALPGMLQRGRGHLVFISSVAALGVPDEEVYSAAKAGLRTFAAAVDRRCARGGVSVTTVLPGAVRTPFFAGRGRAYDRRFPRMVEPEAVATAAVRAVERGRREVFVPRWLVVADRVRGAAPRLYQWLAGEFG